ncbi:MAG TPA: hypothetical protein VL595_04880 [Pseudonocardia sp.]|jgi:hypothetical protein|nr:hypothetical protein [Pseudonocardia sp.]
MSPFAEVIVGVNDGSSITGGSASPARAGRAVEESPPPHLDKEMDT